MKKIVALVLAMVMVLGLATVASAATFDTTLDNALLDVTCTAELDDLAPAVPAAKSFPTWGVYETNVETKNVTTFGPYVQVPSAKNATQVYVDGNKIVYLMTVPATNKYDYNAVAVDVAYANPLYVGCETAYVATTTDIDTYYYFGEKFYEETTAALKTVTFNVDGVLVYAKETTKVAYNYHNFKYDTKLSNDGVKKAVTSVYCADCGKTFQFVNGPKTAAVKAFGAGNFVDTGLDFGGFDIFVAKAPAASAPSVDTDKVESPKTFDAGIAMYVGMSVMAAAGSAVVLKKKD